MISFSCFENYSKVVMVYLVVVQCWVEDDMDCCHLLFLLLLYLDSSHSGVGLLGAKNGIIGLQCRLLLPQGTLVF